MNLVDRSPPSKPAIPNIRPLLEPVIQLLNRRTITILAVLFFAGVSAALWNVSRLSSDLIQSQATQNAALYAQAIQAARTYYSTQAIDRLKSIHQIEIKPDYANQPNAIPIPATFLIELGQTLSQQNPGMAVRLYSDHPFRWRGQAGGPRDEFEREALQALRQNPEQPYVRFTEFEGRPSLRFAQADVMKPTCVACHNTHPDSPKRDWKVGDVRGVLEITRPLDSFIAQTHAGLRSTFLTLGSLLLLALAGIGLVVSRLRQTSVELELRVTERTLQLRQTNQRLQEEQLKSEQLLLNILPEPIAKRLKAGHDQIADGFAEVTVLFADLVNFTELSEQVTPTELVGLLNEIFSCFDRLTEQHGLEKIKTIGDAYMVAAGLPMPRADHAEAIADMAIAMRDELARFNRQHDLACSLRIGINTGPVVAGVIGTKKFIYDLWGDTVNVASRMESHGIAGEIQVTESVYERLKDGYTFERRGTIPIKGKGTMSTYLLTGCKPA